MCSVMSVAKTICEVCNWKISNLKLQKIMYILQLVYMGTHNGKPLFTSDFEAWDYGPVIPELYHTLKMFGAENVEDIFWNAEDISNQEKMDFIKTNAPILAKLTSSQLVNITHRENTAWNKKYIPNKKNIPITTDDIMDEFKNCWEKLLEKNV